MPVRPSFVFHIARFTLQEAVSRRLILAGVLISLGYIGLFALGFHFAFDKAVENSVTPEARLSLGAAFAILTLFGLYVVNYLASFLALFLSVGAISGEIDSGTLHAVLARPVKRAEFVIGRWLGYVVMISVYIVAMSGLVLLTARLIAGYEVPDPVHALLLMVLEGVLLLSLSLFGSTLLPTLANGVVVFTLLGLAWLAGIIEFVGGLLRNAPDTTGADAMLNIGIAVSLLLPSDALWRGASFYLESPSLVAMMGVSRGGIPFFSTSPPTVALVTWAVAYTLVVLGGAVLAFRNRDL
ncbi:MAG TPA: ABC transporter permease subunit [Chloroflexota bacterium]|jgi:ABC-type transport system involved in multi-copper enzyme maturation permease subunit|nr:ABC transporter permease subunit [Chloroflexota bacterium]